MISKSTSHKTVLVVEDDPALLATLEFNLQARGYNALTATDGATAVDRCRSDEVDLVILDLSLPVMGGMQVCKALRDVGDTVPIIMLTAWQEEHHKVDGLRSGADDYVTKPFSLIELFARVEAQLRRSDLNAAFSEETIGKYGRTIKVGDLVIDLLSRSVSKDGFDLGLRAKEFNLFVQLAAHPGRVYSRSQLLEKVWGKNESDSSRLVDVNISLLRHKIELDPAEPRHIITVRGIGYRFAP